MIKIDQHPAYTIQVGKCTAEFDRDYVLTIRKVINGKTTYEVEFSEAAPDNPEIAKMIVDTVVRHLNIHGAFSPKQEDK